MPAVNSFFTKEMIKYEKPFPLKLYICNYCWLIQLSRMPNKKSLFDEYHHISGASEGNVDHLKRLSNIIYKQFPKKRKILEIGCNDTLLLNFLNKKKYDCIGIDPAKNIVKKNNLNILNDYFDSKYAKLLKQRFKSFDIIIGLNVFAHNSTFLDMFKGCEILLNSDGILLFEVAYAPYTIGGN